LIATVVSLVLVPLPSGFLFQKLAINKEKEVDRLQPQVSGLQAKADKFYQAYQRLQKVQKEAEQVARPGCINVIIGVIFWPKCAGR
jgi:predicted transcriptional regulator